jgi:hypothetical protein
MTGIAPTEKIIATKIMSISEQSKNDDQYHRI